MQKITLSPMDQNPPVPKLASNTISPKIVIISLVLITIISSTTTYLFLNYQNLTKPQSQSLNQWPVKQSTVSEQPSPTPTTTSTSDWREYINKDFGISFKYPNTSDWELVDRTSSDRYIKHYLILYKRTPNKYNGDGDLNRDVDIKIDIMEEINKDNLTLDKKMEEFMQDSVEYDNKTKEIIIGEGISAIETISSGGKIEKLPEDEYRIHAQLPNKNFLGVIAYIGYNRNKELIKNIIFTFQFTD